MSKRKTFFIFSVVLIIGICTSTLNAKAANPEHFDLNYDDATSTLSVYIIHGATYTDKHYINHIIIQVGEIVDEHNFTISDDTIVAEATYTSQYHYNINHYEFTFPATRGDDDATGDAILVTATCNLGGIYQYFLTLYPVPLEHEYGFKDVPVPVLIATIIVTILLLLPKLLIKNKEVLVSK